MWFFLSCTATKMMDSGDTEMISPKIYEYDDLLRITDGMVLGTHNSYHLQPEATTVGEWNYSHPSLSIQLDQGVRQFELDVQKDPTTGELMVLHVPVLDPKSNCPLLQDCLDEILAWSTEHPQHFPLQVLIEPKDEIANWSISAQLEDWALLDQMLLNTFGDKLITPDTIQDEYPSLREAVLDKGWPTLATSRGKIIVALLDTGIGRSTYTADLTSLENRILFPLVDEDHEFAAYFLKDDPFDSDIANLARQGFLIRTRGDAGLIFDENRVQTALESGANAISTDLMESRYWMDPSTPVQCAAYNRFVGQNSEICIPSYLE